MINIFFVPGMFGSSLEYMLKNYTDNFESVGGIILADGSMHTFKKEFHPRNVKHLERFHTDLSITTPIYPFSDISLKEIINIWPGELNSSYNVFIYATSLEHAEINMLFQFYKIPKVMTKQGIGLFCGDDSHAVVNWNNAYTHWSQMQPWELREWLSLFYPLWVREWIDIDSSIESVSNKLKVSNTDILYNIEEQFMEIAKFCNLTVSGSYKEFVIEWTDKQQYIINEFKLIDKIINCVLSKDDIEWNSNNICFVSEAIIQRRLRDKGYEIKCFGLNTFPNSSKALYNILEKV